MYKLVGRNEYQKTICYFLLALSVTITGASYMQHIRCQTHRIIPLDISNFIFFL